MEQQHITFNHDTVQTVPTLSDDLGKHIRGCQITAPLDTLETETLTQIRENLAEITSHQVTNRCSTVSSQILFQGCIVDVQFKDQVIEHSTPYRISQIVRSDWNKDQSRYGKKRKFVIVCEPLIEDHFMLILFGSLTEITKTGNLMTHYNRVLRKPNWQTATFSELEAQSDLGTAMDLLSETAEFKIKDQRILSLGVVFDELLTQVLGLETEFFTYTI